MTCDECQLVRDRCEIGGVDSAAVVIPDVDGSVQAADLDEETEVEMETVGISVEDVLAVHSNLLEHVPVKCRVNCPLGLAAELDKVTSQNDSQSCANQLMMAKCCLWVPFTSRGGQNARGKDTLSNIVSEMLVRWQAGDQAALWDELNAHTATCERRKTTLATTLEERQVARAKRLASDSHYNWACEALGSEGLHDKSDDIKKALESLHQASLSHMYPPSCLVQLSLRTMLSGQQCCRSCRFLRLAKHA